MVVPKEILEKEAKRMVSHIVRELQTDFAKTVQEAEDMVRKTGVYESLLREPLGLHESVHNWALSVLADHKDLPALEKYYEEQA